MGNLVKSKAASEDAVSAEEAAKAAAEKAKKGGEGCAGVLKPRLSDVAAQTRHTRPSHRRSSHACKWNCSCKRGTLNGMAEHYRLVMAVLQAGGIPGVDTPCKCLGPLPAPALCAVGGAMGTAAAAGSSAR